MKKLHQIVEVAVDNEECVVLKVLPNSEIDLISTGYFDGNETMFRLTKGDNHTCTVFRNNGKSVSWYWGTSGYTLVTDQVSKMGHLIRDCIVKDLNISIE